MTPRGRGAPPDPMRTERMDLLFVGVTTAGFVLVAAALLALVFGVPLFERRSSPGAGLAEAAPIVPPPVPTGSEGDAADPGDPSAGEPEPAGASGTDEEPRASEAPGASEASGTTAP